MKQTTICALCAALLLAGCGGGGGSSASAPSLVPAPPPNNNAGALAGSLDFAKALKTPATILDGSKAATASGGVSQSTNVGLEGVTQDVINVSVSGPASNANYVFNYDATGDGNTEFSINTSALLTTQFWSTLDIQTGFPTTQEAVIGGAQVNKDGIGGNDGKLWVAMKTDYHKATGDTDYSVGGYWLYAPTNSNPSDYDMGAFFDTPQEHQFKNIGMASGQASYAGEMDGFYMAEINRLGLSEIYTETGFIGGNVALTANFDTNKIGGSVNRIVTTGALNYTRYNGAIQLSETDIGANNFFSGAAVGALDLCFPNILSPVCTDTIPEGEDYDTVVAYWGGMFYGGDGANGDQPAGVGGTIAGAGADDEGIKNFYFIGHFGAEKQ